MKRAKYVMISNEMMSCVSCTEKQRVDVLSSLFKKLSFRDSSSLTSFWTKVNLFRALYLLSNLPIINSSRRIRSKR
jgi:hypothetical protein